MELIVVAFVAGALTVLAPCILPLLPIVIGGSVAGGEQSWKRPFVIAVSLGVSVILFTLLLKATTLFLGVPQLVWQVLAGGLIVLLGLTLLVPRSWEFLGVKLTISSGKLLGKAGQKQGLGGAVLAGAALGPVFNSCSPTYAFILAAVLPSSFAVGLSAIAAYTLGLSLMLLLVALLGQRLIAKLGWAANPNGWFRKGLGVIFIAIGLFVLTGLDKIVQTYLVERGLYDAISAFERNLLH